MKVTQVNPNAKRQPGEDIIETRREPVSCNCLTAIDALLKEQNAEIVAARVQSNRGPMQAVVYWGAVIATSRVQNLRDGKKAPVLVATYCPFCGTRYAP